jgi:uncharacterized hydantoinase/oxoprolinase family protein
MIVGVDIGWRNLAIAQLKGSKAYAKHFDLGKWKSNECMLGQLVQWNARNRVFQGAEWVVIEDQHIGPMTKHRNIAVMWTIAAMAKADCSNVRFMSSRSKFTGLKDLPNINIKDKSVFAACKQLAAMEIDPSSIFKTDAVHEWEHLADALGLAFACARC